MRSNLRYLRIVWFFARLTLHILSWEVAGRRLGLGGWANRSAQARYTRWAALVLYLGDGSRAVLAMRKKDGALKSSIRTPRNYFAS